MRQMKIVNRITSRESVSLNKYLNEISKIPLIDGHQEVILAQKIRQGDKEALNTLVRANLRFVVSVAKQYQNQGFLLIELIGEGNQGLITAAEKFDETRGFKFISYAVWWIRQSILKFFMDHSRILKMPTNVIGSWNNKINNATSMLEQDLQRTPTDEEIAGKIGLEMDDYLLYREALQYHVSADAPVRPNDDDPTSIVETLTHEIQHDKAQEMSDESLQVEIKNILNSLTERDREILSDYFGLNEHRQTYSLDVIAEKLGLTRERVRQLKDKALKKAKKKLVFSGLEDYL